MDYDIIVVGAGTAGARVAVTAANNGAKTLLIGDEPVGGTCLNTGCIPSKALLHSANVYHTIKESSLFGIRCVSKPSFAKIRTRVIDIVSEGRSHVRSTLFTTDNLTFIKGRARFVGPRTVEVLTTHYSAKNIIIATGSRPSIPPIPGLAGLDIITSDNLLSLKKLPKRLIIIGGGYVACEYASFFASFGVKVTILEVAPDILMSLDDDVRLVIKNSLESLGVRLFTGVATTRISFKARQFVCSIAGALQKRVIGDSLLVAAGRTPNTTGLSLSRAGINVTSRGFITVDSFLRTSNKHVYAIGDVNGLSMFAHSAKREAWLVLERILLNKNVRMPRKTIPWAIFTHPPAAGVGASENSLKLSSSDYEVLFAPFTRCGRAKIINKTAGFVKVLHNNGRILGAQVVGPNADDIIHEFVALMHTGSQGVDILKKMIHIHPTLSEVCESLVPK